eukprot:4515815-Alexandrium_andersonii.AAC.1
MRAVEVPQLIRFPHRARAHQCCSCPFSWRRRGRCGPLERRRFASAYHQPDGAHDSTQPSQCALCRCVQSRRPS